MLLSKFKKLFEPKQIISRSKFRKGHHSFSTLSATNKNIPRFESVRPEELRNLPRAQVTTLPNGLRVATEPIPHNKETATVGVWVESGSRYETPQNNGCAHFLEHLAFKGTERRSKHALEREVENIGGHLNAYTSREQTTYFASVLKRDIPQAVDILSDILLNSKLTPESIEEERSTIVQETTEVYKNMEEYVFDYLHDVAFLKDPLGQTILGPIKNINRLSREDMVDYIKAHYVPERMVLVAAGAVDHSQLVDLAREKFGHMKPGGADVPKLSPSRYVGGDYRERQDSLPMVHLAIAYQTSGWKDPATFPLMFMHSLIGNWDSTMVNGEHSSNRLISTVASYRYADKVMPFNTIYHDTGLFGIYSSIYESRLLDMSACLMKALKELMTYTTEDQVNEVRNGLVANAFSGLETSSQVCEELGRQILTYGRRIPADEFVARVNAVDAAAVRETARRFIYDKDHSMATVGPTLELPVYDWFRSKSYSLLS